MIKLTNIQALRALAANLVLVFHLVGLQERLYPDLIHWSAGTSFLGPAGVHCFFVISGFVVIRVADATIDRRQFLTARFLRIYPIYWFYLGLMLLFYFFKASDSGPASSLLKSIALWPEPAPKILPVAWSLVYEVYFYLVVTLGIGGRARLRLWLVLWAALVLLINAWLPNIGQATDPVLFVLASPFTLEFVAGGFVGLYLSSRFAFSTLIAGAVALVSGAIFFQLSPQGRWSEVLLLGFPWLPVIYGVAAAELRFAVGSPRWLVLLGDASYSTYLSHILLMAVAGRALSFVLPASLPYAIASIGFCWVLADVWGIFSYQMLEKPIMRIAAAFRHWMFGRFCVKGSKPGRVNRTWSGDAA
jgi:exopolysaccharide production protein ExoZ